MVTPADEPPASPQAEDPLQTLPVVVQIFGKENEDDEVRANDGEAGAGREGKDDEGDEEVGAEWTVLAAQLQDPQDVLNLVKDVRDKLNARLVAKREAQYRAACAQVEIDFPVPESSSVGLAADKSMSSIKSGNSGGATKKSKKGKKKKKNPIATARRKRQEALDAVPRPLKPYFAVKSFAHPGAFEEETAADEVLIDSPGALRAVFLEWMAVHKQRQRLLAKRAFRDLLALFSQRKSVSDAVLFAIYQLLHNQDLEAFAWDPLISLISLLSRKRSVAPSDGCDADRYRGLAAWGIAKHERAVRAALLQGQSPMPMIVTALGRAESLRSSKPTPEALYFVSAAASLSRFVDQDAFCRGAEAHMCFADLGRRANDGFVLLGSLVTLNNTLRAFARDETVPDAAKRAVLTKVSNHFASPQLIAHDLETKGVLARTDLSTIILAISAVTKACADLPVYIAADLLCSSGAIRRVLALASWAYQGLLLAGASENKIALGDFVVPRAEEALADYIAALCRTCALDANEDPRPVLVRIVLLQTMFLLHAAVHRVQDQMDLTDPNKSLFVELAKLFCKVVQMIRLEWVVIAEAKELERARKVQAAKEAAEMAALRALESGQPAASEESIETDASQSQAPPGAVVDDHPLEWLLRDTELCALRGLRSLLEAKYLAAEDIAEHLLPDYLSPLASFLECISDEARRCSIDVLNRFVHTFEGMDNKSRANLLLREVASHVEPVLVVDTLLEHPQEDNAAFLLCRVMKHSPESSAAEIMSNVLTLIDHRTMNISARSGQHENTDVLIVTYLLDVVQHVAERPARRRLMGTLEGGGAVEVILGCLSRMLAMSWRPFQVYECVVRACMALTQVLQDVDNAERFTNARGVQMLCALAEEFSSTSAQLAPGPEKTSHYEVLVHTLKLWRVIIMTRSVPFQQEMLCAEVMDTLFTIACADFEDEAPKYLKSAAHAKRLAASILAALPFKREVAEPCLIAVARKFICQDYSSMLCIAVEQQAFGARLFSRVEISETGHELLRRSKVVKALLQFACHELPPEATPDHRASDDARKQSALIGLLYLCAEDPKTQVYVCTSSLYRLLKSAWTSTSPQSVFQHALVGRLLEQLARNKLNRTRLFKAEMRARAIAHRAHRNAEVPVVAPIEKDARPRSLAAKRASAPSGNGTAEAADPGDADLASYHSIEEASAASELHELIRVRHEFSAWLDKETGKKRKKLGPKGIPAGSQGQVDAGLPASPTRIPALPKKASTRPTLEDSKLWSFKDSILTPQANLSAVACSNGRSPREAPLGDLFQALNQPMKLLWTNREIVDTIQHGREGSPRKADAAAPLGTLKSDKLWQIKESVDPFQALVNRVPDPGFVADMDVPDLAFLYETRGSTLTLTIADDGGADDSEDATASSLLTATTLSRWVPGFCDLGGPPDTDTVVRPRAYSGTTQWAAKVDKLKLWDARGDLEQLPVVLRVRDIAVHQPEDEETKADETPAADGCRDSVYSDIIKERLGVDDDDGVVLDGLCPLYLYYAGRAVLDARTLFQELGLDPPAKKEASPDTLDSFLDLVRARLEAGKSAQEIADALQAKFGEADLHTLFLWQRELTTLRPIFLDHTPLLDEIGSVDALYALADRAGEIPEEDLALARAMAALFASSKQDDADERVNRALGVMLCWLAPAFVKQPVRLREDALLEQQEQQKAAARRARSTSQQQGEEPGMAPQEHIPLARAVRLLLAHLHAASKSLPPK